MKQQLENRLKALKDELSSGQSMMAELEQKQSKLHHTMLRISGAIQVLEELLQEAGENGESETVDDVEKPSATLHTVPSS